MNRLPTPPPEHTDGASLIEPDLGAAGDLVRSGGKVCPLCDRELSWGDMEHDGRIITIEVICGCGFTAKAVFRLIDATF